MSFISLHKIKELITDRNIKQKCSNEFLRLVNELINSSFKYYQNIYSTKNIEIWNLSLAFPLTNTFIKEKGRGACRVHSDGFAGIILVFLPQ